MEVIYRRMLFIVFLDMFFIAWYITSIISFIYSTSIR
jgi:uncharacterized membrane protein